MRKLLLAVVSSVLLACPAFGQAPVEYVVSFPEPHHRYLEVDVTFPEVDATPLEVRMSRTSPGRYALHEFAKNVYDVRASDGQDRAIRPVRPDPHQWDIGGHDGTVRVTYKVYGDRVDGTYLAVDATHAHINMPPALMWARGLEDRPVVVRFEPPDGSRWRVATQLFETADPFTFTAPNLQYLMDSPTELSDFTLRTFSVETRAGPSHFRIALHHDGTDEDADAYARDVERIVRETIPIFGELPAFDNGSYAFIADYLPYASGDAMEHRNSTILTSAASLRTSRSGLLGSVAHEFVHVWNVERIRPASLEPFDFEEANMSGELWFAEGFTSYYTTLVMHRAGLQGLDATAAAFCRMVELLALSPGRRFRSIVDMSRLAPFVDAARAVDRTNWDNTFISYYPGGAAIGLALDLMLRDRTDGRRTLDDYMRAMWERHGRPVSPRVGYVAAPYTMEDLREVLADVVGDRAFAERFFDRYVEGRELAEYGPLLERAGLLLRRRHPGTGWVGDLQLRAGSGGLIVEAPTPIGSPAYVAGVAQDDRLISLGGDQLTTPEVLQAVLARSSPGVRLPLVFERRGAGLVWTEVTLEEDERIELVPVERTGASPTPAQQAFRDAWLGSRAERP